MDHEHPAHFDFETWQRLARSDPERFEAPYVLAVVALEEGPHMLTNLVECAQDEIRVEMPVEVRFERIDDEFTVYPFAPAGA